MVGIYDKEQPFPISHTEEVHKYSRPRPIPNGNMSHQFQTPQKLIITVSPEIIAASIIFAVVPQSTPGPYFPSREHDLAINYS